MASTLLFLLGTLLAAPSATAQDIEVTSADPPSAPQATLNLGVSIKGKGFKKGAVARFFVTGTTNPGGITVNATAFKSPTELIANIDVAADAVIDKFDIEVLAAGRTGKGTELFAVTAKGTSALMPAELTLRDATSDRIRSDGLGLAAGSPSASSYRDPEICVIAWVDSTNGRFFIRIEGGGDCDLKTLDRTLLLDFSDAIERTGNCQVGQACCQVDDAFGQEGVLDICGVNEVTDVRIIADKLFQNAAPLTTPVLLAFSLAPDFRNTGFELQFEQSVPASGDVSLTRTLSAGPQAVAELYKYQAKGGRKVSLGRFRMPFEMIVTLQ